MFCNIERYWCAFELRASRPSCVQDSHVALTVGFNFRTAKYFDQHLWYRLPGWSPERPGELFVLDEEG